MPFTEAEATAFMRVQVAMWVDGKTACGACGKPYASVDDFIERQPRRGPGGFAGPTGFIDSACWTPEWDARCAAQPATGRT